jgi:hypothetical protein
MSTKMRHLAIQPTPALWLSNPNDRLAAGAIKAYIVSVGGFLGMGTRYVAIDPKAVTLTRQDEKTWKATMNANKDQLRAAPEYKYESEWRKR